jgi:hypothetical protein
LTVERLTWAQVHAFRLRRHHLSARAPEKQLVTVVGDIGGTQAQLMSAAELQIAVRVDCTVGDVRGALWKDRSLVKTWLMRGTLHLAPSGDLPIYAGAMSGPWMHVRQSWLRYLDTTEAEFSNVVDEIGAALSDTPMTREDLIAVVAKGKSPHIRELLKSGWGGMLKPAARSGRLCFGPNRGQSVTFVSPRHWLASWRDMDPHEAIAEMGRRYLRAFGPATRIDFARWWGAWRGVGKAAWDGLRDELVPVDVEGARLDALAADLPELRASSIGEPVQLLPAFDPYVLGHASRDHLFEPAFASRVSRTAGWISAVVLLDGVVVGTWTHTLKNRRLNVTVTPFRKLASRVRAGIKTKAGALAESLEAESLEVKFA